MLRVEKQIASKTQAQLKQKDSELKQVRQDYIDMEQKLREQVNSLSLRDSELSQQVEQLSEAKKLTKARAPKPCKDQLPNTKQPLNARAPKPPEGQLPDTKHSMPYHPDL